MTPPSSTTLSVRGLQFSDARSLIDSRQMAVGDSIRLVAEPGNRFDANAVAFQHVKTRKRLGYVSKDRALKYKNLLALNGIVEASISSIESTRILRIHVSVRYREDPASVIARKTSRFLADVEKAPSTSGIYVIANLSNGWQYIGQASNLKRRMNEHRRSLEGGRHDNARLDRDYKASGPNGFGVTYRVMGPTSTDLDRAERDAIKSALAAGAQLYNMTADGHGKWRPEGSFSSNNQTISEKWDADTARARRLEHQRLREAVLQKYAISKEAYITDAVGPKDGLQVQACLVGAVASLVACWLMGPFGFIVGAGSAIWFYMANVGDKTDSAKRSPGYVALQEAERAELMRIDATA